MSKGNKRNKGSTLKLSGMPAFSGNASGTAVLIDDSKKEKKDVRGKYILVVEATYPEYLPIMLKANGIVAEIGGLLSHAAITAREFRIPCVVGVVDATKLIKRGDIVEIRENGAVFVKQKR